MLFRSIINLINAFSKTNNGELYIAGDGPERERIINYIKENRLKDRIKMLGFLNKKEVIDFISRSSFIVVPSICNENCPYSILETLAVGKPIIGANIGGIPELVQDGKNGFIYECNDIDKLTKCMNKLYTDKDLVEKMSDYSKKLSLDYSKYEYYRKLI